jgi:hypothetical protein
MCDLETISKDCCQKCNSKNPNKACGGCKSAFYCGDKCQKTDWNAHRKICGVMASVRKFDFGDSSLTKEIPDSMRNENKDVDEKDYLNLLHSFNDKKKESSPKLEEEEEDYPSFIVEDSDITLERMSLETSMMSILSKDGEDKIPLSHNRSFVSMKGHGKRSEQFQISVGIYFVKASDTVLKNEIQYEVRRRDSDKADDWDALKEELQEKKFIPRSDKKLYWNFYFRFPPKTFESAKKLVRAYRILEKNVFMETYGNKKASYSDVQLRRKKNLVVNFSEMKSYFYSVVAAIIKKDILQEDDGKKRKDVVEKKSTIKTEFNKKEYEGDSDDDSSEGIDGSEDHM